MKIPTDPPDCLDCGQPMVDDLSWHGFTWACDDCKVVNTIGYHQTWVKDADNKNGGKCDD